MRPNEDLVVKKKTKTLDDKSWASDPGQISLSYAKLQKLDPTFCPNLSLLSAIRSIIDPVYARIMTRFSEQLQHGDSRAAVVMTLTPQLLVAAYTDELDCVILLQFPNWLIREYGLSLGTRLLTVNTYGRGQQIMRDLVPGPQTYGRYTNFSPYIADFLSDDAARLQFRKSQITEEEWARTRQLGMEYMRQFPGQARDGRPRLSSLPSVR